MLIARAVCGGRRILLLDEATSALDNKTQKHVSDSLDALACTRVVVAHRLSTVRHCDRILVVDGGRDCKKRKRQAKKAAQKEVPKHRLWPLSCSLEPCCIPTGSK